MGHCGRSGLGGKRCGGQLNGTGIGTETGDNCVSVGPKVPKKPPEAIGMGCGGIETLLAASEVNNPVKFHSIILLMPKSA